MKIFYNVIREHFMQKGFFIKHPNEGWIVLSATNYFDIVRFCPANSLLINFRSIKNILVLSPLIMQSIPTQKYWLSGGGRTVGCAEEKLILRRNEELILLYCFKLGWNFTFWQLAVSIM